MSIRCFTPLRPCPQTLLALGYYLLGTRRHCHRRCSDTITEISSGLAYYQVDGGFSFLICYALLYIAISLFISSGFMTRDTPGWWMLFFFLFMMLFTVIIGLLPSEHQDNHYGPDTDANGRYLG